MVARARLLVELIVVIGWVGVAIRWRRRRGRGVAPPPTKPLSLPMTAGDRS